MLFTGFPELSTVMSRIGLPLFISWRGGCSFWAHCASSVESFGTWSSKVGEFLAVDATDRP